MDQQYAPIYKEDGKTYHADSCDSLIDAVENGELELDAIGRATYPGKRIPEQVLPGLQSAGYWDAKQEQSWGLPWHRNEGIELSFLETGIMPFFVDEKKHMLSPGSLSITRPWQPHRLGCPNIGVGRLHWIIIDVGVRQPHQEWKWPEWLVIMPDDLAELTACLRENEQPVWSASAEIQDCFRQIGAAIREKRSPSRLAVYANELLLHLLDLFREKNVVRTTSLTDAQRSVELFLSSLEASYAEEWSLQSMARCCGLGVTRFVHYCCQITNLTPMQYLNHVRLSSAADMLRRNPEQRITEIAFDSGFSTSQYFATAFRKQYGCTPREYRMGR
jgi:AraC family L-rhamnose operon regulatory protein RhaS